MRYPEACNWLRDKLGDSVHASLDVHSCATAVGVGKSMLRNVRQSLGVECFRRSDAFGAFFMCLPGVDHGEGMMAASAYVAPLVRSDVVIATELTMLHRELVKADGALSRMGLLAQVEWVAERLLVRMEDMTVKEVPCGSAVALLLWAKSNQDAFRQMYDSKRMERAAAGSRDSAKAENKKSSLSDGRSAIDDLLNRSGNGSQAVDGDV